METCMRPEYSRHLWFALALVVLIVILVKIQRSAPPADPALPGKSVKTVSVEQLGKETDHWIFFSYLGGKGEFDYFLTPDQKHYRVARSESKLYGRLWLDGDHGVRGQLFVTVRDGKITVPDPKVMSEISEYELDRPYKRK
jgi:hypothetical protein